MLDKIYSPDRFIHKWLSIWQKAKAFGADPQAKKKPFTIMMPPANVTGTLHVGHALTYTLQDILVRYHRMLGEDVLWQPGVDHAGIATQMVVERNLSAEGIDRRTIGREEFLKHVWAWKDKSGDIISEQLRLLGCSADWDRSRFTMDDGLSKAVQDVFIDLYKKGLIYKDKRLVNWDPKLLTAISDLEVEQKDIKGHLWYIKYPLSNDSARFITVATSRPETLFGDTGIAVHPEDPRYKDFVGQEVKHPFDGRILPIVADPQMDMEKGSGAVKITPAHDFNDFAVGKRHGLEIRNILTQTAHLNDLVPEDYRGLDRFVARKKIVDDLKCRELLEKIEDIQHTVPHGDRSGVIIEPLLMDQWYVNAKKLSEPALKAVKEGQTVFVPEQWKNTYFEWLNNIEPWCISRQIWWGHRIPAWYGPDGFIFVEKNEEDALRAAKNHYGSVVPLTQDEDVLDTWFSSALWPFSTLGWPEQLPELERYYPTDVLVTGFDIIFFWVARMMMMGLYFMKEVPFKKVYIHALVRDEKGQKMSKSKGNVLDPTVLIEKFGTDALRFTLCALSAQGRDVKLSEARIEGYRNFTTKIWNVARFLEMNGCVCPQGFSPDAVHGVMSQWIFYEIKSLSEVVGQALDAYKFNEAAHHLYQGVWHTFCDWVIEFSKCCFQTQDLQTEELKQTLAWAFGQILHLLHPIMPFITEELWEFFQEKNDEKKLLITASWPKLSDTFKNHEVKEEIDWVIALITEIRSFRSEMNISPKEYISIHVKEGDQKSFVLLKKYNLFLCSLARVKSFSWEAPPSEEVSLTIIFKDLGLSFPVDGLLDLEVEISRLALEIVKIEKEILSITKRLEDPNVVARAPMEIIEELRMRETTLISQRERFSRAIVLLKGKS